MEGKGRRNDIFPRSSLALTGPGDRGPRSD